MTFATNTVSEIHRTPNIELIVEYIWGWTVWTTWLTTDPWISYSLGSKDIYVKLSWSLDWTDGTELT